MNKDLTSVSGSTIWNERIYSTHLKEISGRWIYSGSLCAMEASNACKAISNQDFLTSWELEVVHFRSRCQNAQTSSPISLYFLYDCMFCKYGPMSRRKRESKCEQEIPSSLWRTKVVHHDCDHVDSRTASNLNFLRHVFGHRHARQI